MDVTWINGLFIAEVIIAVLAAELRNLKWATFALALQSLFVVAIISSFGYLTSNHSLYWWAVTAFILKVILIPLLLWLYMRKMPAHEIKPVIGLIPSILVMAVILIATYYFTLNNLYPSLKEYLPSVDKGISDATGVNLSLGFTLIALGVYVLLIRRDIFKVVIGLVILENGVHLTLVSLAPTLEETSEIGIACNLVIVSWLLLYLANNIYKFWETKDTTSLSELKW